MPAPNGTGRLNGRATHTTHRSNPRELKFPPGRADDDPGRSPDGPRPGAGGGAMDVQLPPGIDRALRVLKANLSDLLARHPGAWAACDGAAVRYVGTSWQTLYDRCLDEGLHPDEFVVRCLLPDAVDGVV